MSFPVLSQIEPQAPLLSLSSLLFSSLLFSSLLSLLFSSLLFSSLLFSSLLFSSLLFSSLLPSLSGQAHPSTTNMNGDGGERRCITEKAVDLPQRVQFFAFRCIFKHFSTCWRYSTCEKCLKLQRKAKNGHIVDGQRHHRHHMQKNT